MGKVEIGIYFCVTADILNLISCHGKRKANFLHAAFTVFWLNIALIAVRSGERCGPWASGFIY